MFHKCGLEIDQSFTVAWRELKYTLIHLSKEKKARLSVITKVMHKLQEIYGIVNGNIFGFDSITSNTKATDQITLETHPGFKQMVRILNTKRNELEWWMQNDHDILNNRKGLLWKYIEETDASNMTKAQLIRRVNEWAPIIRGFKATPSETPDAMVHKPIPKPSTRATLLRYRIDSHARDTMRRVIRVEKALRGSEIGAKTQRGFIYAAWNKLMEDLHKLGFTNKDATTRVRALQTAGVLEPFELVREAEVPNARLYEKAMHIYFRDVRIHKRKEFFAISREEVNRFFDMLTTDEGTTKEVHTTFDEEQKQWLYSLAKAAHRCTSSISSS